MTLPVAPHHHVAEGLWETLDRVLTRIAPTWPLDRFIAVNPLWGRIDRPVEVAAAELAAATGVRLTMPRTWMRARFAEGAFEERHIRDALLARGQVELTVGAVLAALAVDEVPVRVRPLVARLRKAPPDAPRPWSDFVRHAISQHCAAWFDRGQASLKRVDGAGLYASWRTIAPLDLSPRLTMGADAFPAELAALPESARDALAGALQELGVRPEDREDYLTSLAHDVLGWASWCAYLRWTEPSASGEDPLVDLVAIRASYDAVLLRTGDDALRRAWEAEMARWPHRAPAAQRAREVDWVLQRALELACHERVARRILGTRSTPSEVARSLTVFCIDVRSEPLRRALETVDDGVRTAGFAGFFGLAAEYAPTADRPRPHLPGLLTPSVRIEDTGVPEIASGRRRTLLAALASLKRFKQEALSGFTFVEAFGLAYAPGLLGGALGLTRPAVDPERTGLTPAEHAGRRPRLTTALDGTPLTADQRADIAAGILRNLGVRHGAPRLVALVGHGARTTNNPHAAGLDCGACCGRSGEVNARAVADLLNEPEVRARLASRGVHLAEGTWFVAALHETTTDRVELFAPEGTPPEALEEVARLRASFERATARVRAERAQALGIEGARGEALRAAIERRAGDWAEVRPEWGLAGNAAFVAAPRARTRGVDLEGRAFLHDYDWRTDEGFAALTLILTAPVVVAHWINFQYYASTTDPVRLGAGDKLLHNVVAGGIGVFEGGCGDLRIGLPWQSVHDGERYVHQPVRLGVFVEAPRAAIESVLEAHPTVRMLADHGWIHLHQIDGERERVHRWEAGGWSPVGAAA